jgi:hypothetical protein
LPSFAQVATARLEGTVLDSTGAAIPAAKLTLVNNKTQVRLDAEANAEGFYIFGSVQPGVYTLTAEANGFRKAQITSIELVVGGVLQQAVRMEVGTVTDSVVVEASTVRVQTTDSAISRAVTMKDIDTLPQLGRSPIILAAYQPGVQVANPGDTTFSRVNGQRQGSNNATLDGIDVNDAVLPRLGLSLTSNNTDSVGEFRIITNGAKAEYGRNAGGQVELITRSGTNRFSGNLFEYHRNTVLNANTFFNNATVETPTVKAPARPKFIQNQFGGSIGGPILLPKIYNGKDRTFFFFNFQAVRTAQETARTRTVLTPQARAGLFRWNTAAGTQAFDIIANDPRRLGIDKKVKEQLDLLPLPNAFDVGDGLNTAGFRFNSSTPSQSNQLTAKFDHNLSSSHRVFFRYSRQTNVSNDALNNADPTFPGQPSGTQGGTRWGWAANSSWVIKPNLINEFVAGYQSASVVFFRVRPRRDVIIPNLYTAPLPSGTGSERNSPVIQFNDNLSWIKGRHSFKGGLRLAFTQQYASSDAGIFPNINLSRANNNIPPATLGPQGTTTAVRQQFENLYNDLLGRVSNINTTFYSDLNTFQPAGTPRLRNFRFNDYSYFFQDDWRVTNRFTINIGIRWEFYGVPFERDGLQGVVDQKDKINMIANVSNVSIKRGADWYNNDWNNFAPRFGFAWDPFGNGKTAIRGSYGVFYDRVIGATATDVDGATPGFSQVQQVFPNTAANSDVRAADSSLTFPTAPSAPILTVAPNRTNALVLFHPNFRTPYVHQFNLTVQHEVFRNTVAEIGYVGNRGVKLLTDVNYNQRRIYGDFLQAFKEIEAFRANGTPVPATNSLVRMFGSAQNALNTLGASNFQIGAVGTVAQTVDVNNFSRYATAGLSDYYVRNFPQFDILPVATNDGRSYYNSMQASLRRQTGSLRFAVNYTLSKTIDNVSVDGSGFTRPIDSFNLILNRGRSDTDRPHTFNWSASYILPFGKGRKFGSNWGGFTDSLLGGWEVGVLGLWTSGPTFTVGSTRQTAAADTNTWANFNGSDRNIGSPQRVGNGVIFWSPAEIAQFSFPGAGEIGTSGRNTFRGPRYFNSDVSLVKRFKLPWEGHTVTFRAEAYNVFNNVNFNTPNTTLTDATNFGRINTLVGNSRIMQGALRYDF